MPKKRTHNVTHRGRIPKKGITLPNGNRINMGQLFPAQRKDTTTMGQADQIARRRAPDGPSQTALEIAAANRADARAKGVPKDPVTNAALGRDGRVPKHSFLADPPIHPNMKRQTRGEFGFHHGVIVEDEPLTTKVSDASKGGVPVHPAMKDQTRTGNRILGSHSVTAANDVLREAAALGGGQRWPGDADCPK